MNSLTGSIGVSRLLTQFQSLRLHWCLWPIVGCEGRSQGRAKIQRSRCGEAEGAAPSGSGEAVYCRSSSKRWPYSWIRSLNICSRVFPSFDLSYVDYQASLFWRILLPVCFIWEYNLMSDAWNLVAVWWGFFSRQKLVYVVDILVIVCSILSCNSYETDFGIWDQKVFKITFLSVWARWVIMLLRTLIIKGLEDKSLEPKWFRGKLTTVLKVNGL